MLAVGDRPPFLAAPVVVPEFDDDVEKRGQDGDDVGVAIHREVVVDHAVGIAGTAVGQMDEFEHAFGAVLLEQWYQRVDTDAKFRGCKPVGVGFELVDGGRDADPEIGEGRGPDRSVVGRRRIAVRRARGSCTGCATSVGVVTDEPDPLRNAVVDQGDVVTGVSGRRDEDPATRLDGRFPQ